MRILDIWDCLDQDQVVGAKHINETEMFQMTSREPLELIDKEVGDLVDLEDVSESEHANDSVERTEDVNDENVEQTTDPVERPPTRSTFKLKCIIWKSYCIICKIFIVKI